MTLTLSDGAQQFGPFTVTTAWQFGNLCSGVYSVLIIDANGDTCTGNTNFIITSIPGPDATVTVTNASCTLCADGAATVSVSGGVAPYTYLLSTGSTAPSNCCLTPGMYISYVTDANGCADVDTFFVGVGANGNFVMTGKVFLDLNADGIMDAGEPGMPNQLIDLLPIGGYAITNSQGDYGMAASPGTYDVTINPGPGWTISTSPANYNIVLTSDTSELNFGIAPDTTTGEANVMLTYGWPRCYWDVPYYPRVYNTGYTMLNGVLTFTYDPAQVFVSTNVTPFSHVGNVLTYTYDSLFPGQAFVPTVVLTEPGPGIAITTSVNATGTDVYGYQFGLNSTVPQIIVCSMDPNDKSVQPIGIGPGNYVAMDTWLDYMIRFQNTGTDTAFTVVVIDTLDATLDLSTFTFIGASHPVYITRDAGSEFTFTFDNILLPDSNVNEAASHGYILYRIKGNSNNPDPTVANNTAYIYFDLNSPVVTNTTLTTFSDNYLSIADIAGENALFELFPNPMDDVTLLRLKAPSNVQYKITMTDIQGRVIFESQKLLNGSLLIENDLLPSGTYILQATPSSNEKPIHLRLVKK